MPFLAVCPDCHYSQVCVLPESTFPRIKCCRCRQVYDPVGSQDTEVIPELAGADVARHILKRRAARLRARTMRARSRKKARRAARTARAMAPSSAPELSPDEVAAAVLSAPESGPATTDPIQPPAADTEPQTSSGGTAPNSGAPEPVPTPVPHPFRKGLIRRARSAAPAATPLTAGALFVLGAGLAVAASDGVGFLLSPLAIISLVLGVWAIRVAKREGVQAAYAVIVTVLAAAVVVASFLVPGHLRLAPE